jgi:anti-anti-sigma factor
MGDVVDAPTLTQLSPFKHGSLFDEDISIPEPIAELLTDPHCRKESAIVADGVLRVVGVTELTAAHSRRFRKQVRDALDGHAVIEIDLSQTTAMDCAGLGALIAIRNHTRDRKGVVRLLNPRSRVLQLLELMRAEQVFEIVKSSN